MRRKTALVLLAAATLALVVWSVLQSRAGRRTHTAHTFAMDTVMSFTACGPNGEAAVQAGMAEVRRLDALLSAENPDSEVSRLNAAGSLRLSEDARRLLSSALAAYRDTGGLFDCTIYPLMVLWGFPSRSYRVPPQQELDALLPLVGSDRVRLDGNHASLDSGQQLDLGGIAKGYASSRIMDLFREQGVRSGMVSLGGNVQVLGSRPDGTPWRIGIRDPDNGQNDYLAVVEAVDEAIVTSGGTERFFEADGQRYIHILDPRTGRPARSDLQSATVVSSDGTLADALSTALYIMGRDGAAGYWRAHGGFELILLGNDGRLYVTQGLANRIQSNLTIVPIEK